MRKGISITVTRADRVHLQSIIRNRNSPQKHVWRARIVILTADGNGTSAITRAVGKGKTVVWRWQERFMREGVEGLTRDKTRPSRIPPLPAETVDRVIALTNQPPPHEATHWTAPAMAKAISEVPGSIPPPCGAATTTRLPRPHVAMENASAGSAAHSAAKFGYVSPFRRATSG